MRTTKILCLHGFGQSGALMQEWTEGLVRQINEVAPTVFHFPTAHIALSTQNSKDFQSIPSKLRKQPSFAWNNHYLDWQRQFSGLPLALSYLKIILQQEGPFDGLIGFSQGAAYGVALASLLEDASLAEECRLPLINHPAFKFTILFSGCKVSTFRFAPLYREIKTPTLIYYFVDDKIIPSRWTAALAANCSDVILQAHREGHRIPRCPDIHRMVAGFMAKHTGPLMGTESDFASPDVESTRLRCPSDWMNLIEETPFALPRL